MRLEDIPTILGALVALLGLWLLWDSASSDGAPAVRRERRRRERADRDRVGEAALGLGTLCMAAALIGRDTWRFGNVAVIAGTILLVAGAALNFRFLRELLVFRGPARRQDERAPRGPEADRYVFGPAQGASDRPAPGASAPPGRRPAPSGSPAPADSTATVPPPRPVQAPGDEASPGGAPGPGPADGGDSRLRIR